MREIGLHHQHRLLLPEGVRQHPVQELVALLGALLAMGARLTLFLHLPPSFGLAGADVRLTHVDQLAGNVIVKLETLRLDHRLVDLHAQPLQVLRYHPVGIGVDLVRIGVLDPVDVLALVPPHVLVIEDGDPGVAKMERPRWSRCHAHDHLALDRSRQLRKLVLPLRLGLLEQVRVRSFGEAAHLIYRQAGYLPAHLVRRRRDLLGPGAQCWLLGEHLPHNGLGIGLAPIQSGVLERILPDDLSEIGGHCSAIGQPVILPFAPRIGPESLLHVRTPLLVRSCGAGHWTRSR
ncbi:MAG: hypothetical protein A4E29_00054 [Methanomassiliicoccales archaeon PtaB.Bin134]|nr:MAG: hypothetical protein A4E29_00054 [Methanomassiliicoccales archaeon PtaB.Bin134]